MKHLSEIKDWKECINQVVCGDSLDLMRMIPDNAIDLCLTDPPYGIGESMIQNKDITSKYGMKGKRHDSFDWDNQTPTQEYFDEMFRVSKRQIIWGGNYFDLPPSRCWIVWDKMNDKFYSTSDGELAWTSFDSRLRFFRRSHGLDKGFMTRKEGFGNVHPTQKPLELMRWCLENYGKDSQLIIDPFGGSGTTARACKDMGKDFIIIDKEEKYCEIMEKRLEQEVLF